MTNSINIRPYSKIENRQFDICEIIISEKDFKNTDYKSGRITFVFENCDFNKIVVKNSENVDFKDISISFNYSLVKDIQIEEIKSANISLSFFSSIVSGNINNHELDHIHINNCLTESLFLQNQKKVNLAYTEENIFPLQWKKIFDRIKIPSIKEFLERKQSVYINNSEIINVYGNPRQKDLQSGIYKRSYEKVKDYKIGYYLSEEQKNLLNINLSISYSNSVTDVQTDVKNLQLNSLSIDGNSKGKISIEQTNINDFYIFNFSTQQETLIYSLSPIKENSKLSIHKSNLDNVWFDNIEFSRYSIVSFYRSRFAKSSFTSCNFPVATINFEKFQALENVHYPQSKPDNYYKDQYEIFLQLKEALEKTGNFYEALKLKAISKEALRKIKSISKSDKCILRINFWSNEHGLSIIRPFWGLLISSIVLYIFYLLSINRIFNSTELDWTLVGHYFSFLDITHKKDFIVPRSEFNVWSLTIDFVNKIIVGFFIYQ
jgi:hypothetical protein